MYIKWIGALMVVLGCGGYGILLAMNHRREVAALRQLVQGIDVMIWELEYRLTPLPDLCRLGAESAAGAVRTCLAAIAAALDEQVSPDVGICVTHALKKVPAIPKYAASQIQALGQTLGRFDLSGQVTALHQCKQACLGQLEVLEHHQPQRLRSYKTIGFCAGVALAIILF